MPDDYNGTSVPEHQNPDPKDEGQNDNIPDWMKEAGWEKDSGTFDESQPVFDDLDDDEEEDILPADIPAWLEEAAPEGFSSDPDATPAFEGLDVDEPFITTGDLVPPPSMESPAEEPEPEPAEPSEESEPAQSGSGFDLPGWLENLELHEDSQETAIAWLENMPDSLRATEEEIEAARQFPEEEPDVIEEPVDDLAWVDEIGLDLESPPPESEVEAAELSEDLVASELLPEPGEEDQIFRQDEIQSMESELPSWLKELGDDQPGPEEEFEQILDEPAGEVEEPQPAQEDNMPDWLQSSQEMAPPPAEEEMVPPTASEEPEPAPEPELPSAQEEEDQIPDWLGEFEADSADSPEAAESLGWLDSLGREEPEPASSEADRLEGFGEDSPAGELMDEPPLPAGVEQTPEQTVPDGVSPNDETLNAQVPDWLSKIGEVDEETEDEPTLEDYLETPADAGAPAPESEFESSSSWLDQIDEKPQEGFEGDAVSGESEIADWLQEMQGLEEESSEAYQEPAAETSPDQASAEELSGELTSAAFPTPEEDASADDPGDMPDWLSELRQDEEDSLSLEEAIRSSEGDLNEEEADFLSRIEEKQEEDSDWLSKLDQIEPAPESAEAPAPVEDFDQIFEQAETEADESIVSGGVLDRLRDTSEIKPADEVPQWLADIKNEEDPQETAVLWLKQFVDQDGDVDIQDEIKRYTDELDPGTSVPKWMEDLKNEEDPQTTAMLWLEKLSSQQPEAAPEPPTKEEEDSGWLADLEQEAARDAQASSADEASDFDDPDQGWLSDLEIDEKLKTSDEDLPEWTKPEEETPEGEPPWMRATSPLEGDFYTDELAGSEEKEAEIPEWLAGYAEGETPPEADSQDEEIGDEYTWLSATDAPSATRSPLDLNRAAISQLESILGISHQIARGIVSYREKNGPYRDFADLKNVPEIVDEQTIDILKPEVFISEPPPVEQEPEASPPVQTEPETAPPVEPEPAPAKKKPAKKAAAKMNFEEILVTARARVKDREIDQAVEQYSKLIKKKKFLDETIEDLKGAALDFPLEIAVHQSLGDAYMAKDLLDQALEAYSKAEDLLA